MKPSWFVLPIAALLSAGILYADSSPALTATPNALRFAWEMGTALPGAQTVSVRSSAVGAVPFTATTPPSDEWLTVSPAAGNLPGILTINVNPGTLAPQTWTSSVTVTAGTATTTINITLVVTLPAGGAVIQPSSISLTSPGTVSGTFSIVAGPAPVTYTVATGTKWLTVSPTAGAVLPGETLPITVTANPAGLSPKSTPYTGKVTVVTSVNASSRTATVSVSLTVSPAAPTITSVWPSQIPVGSLDTVVTVRGSSFYSATTITASGVAKALKTTLLNSGVMLATLPQAILASAGAVTSPRRIRPRVALRPGLPSVLETHLSSARSRTAPVLPQEQSAPER